MQNFSRRLMGLVGLSVGAISAPLCAQVVYYLPQVIDGPSASGSLRSTIVLTNPNSSSANVTLNLTRDDGSPLAVNFPALSSGSQFSLTLKPNGTSILQTDGSGDGSGGAATISANVPIGVSTITSVYDASANLVSESGTGNSITAPAFVIPVDSRLGVNTGVALFNPNPTATNLTFTLLDASGTAVGKATGTLAPGAHLARTAAGDLFSGVSGFQGTMLVESTLPTAAVTFRQNVSGPGYTLLEAESQTAMPLWHYFPQLADGPSGTATLQTSLLLYNLSKKPASVTVSLSQDSGIPWLVNIPGVGANNSFTVTLAPGESAVLQTDGQGALTTGAARITSDQPVGAKAVVTAADGNGNLLSETGMGEAALEQAFLLAVDATNGRNTGAAFFNPGSQPVTLHLNLLDTDQNLVASTQLQPLAPGAHLAAYVSDWFPGTAGVLGTLSITAGDGVGAAVAALALRQNGTALAMASLPVAAVSLTGTGINVSPSLDSAHKVSGLITPSGGSLSLTDAKGNKFGLTIPANALINSVQVTMTPATSLSGLPPGGTFSAGVQLEPDGLALFQIAQLTIEPASPPDAGTTIPLGWHGTGQGVYLNLVQPRSGKLTMLLTHFSGAAVVTGPDAYITSQLLNVANAIDLDQSRVGVLLTKARAKEVAGQDGSKELQQALDIAAAAFIDIQQLMELALQSNDDDLLRCASTYAISYDRQRQMLRPAENTGDAISQAIFSFVQTAANILQQRAMDRCARLHDPIAGLELLGGTRQAQILFGTADAPGGVPDVSQCSPKPVLDFQSQISGTLTSKKATSTFDASLRAKVILTLTPPPPSAEKNQNGYVSFGLSGSGALNYDYAKVVVEGCSSRGNPVGSTLKVTAPNSQIQYQYTPKFQPKAISISGKTLASFCPVYDKSPVSVTMALDVGKPFENFACAGGPQLSSGPLPSLPGFWQVYWTVLHIGGMITDWQIPGANSFAHKEFSRTSQGANSEQTVDVTEKSKLDLNQQQ